MVCGGEAAQFRNHENIGTTRTVGKNEEEGADELVFPRYPAMAAVVDKAAPRGGSDRRFCVRAGGIISERCQRRHPSFGDKILH